MVKMDPIGAASYNVAVYKNVSTASKKDLLYWTQYVYAINRTLRIIIIIIYLTAIWF
jgi:hypothetical protein